MLHYLFVTSLLCSRLELSPLLFVTSQYIFKFPLFHYKSVCCVTALFSASAISSSICCVTRAMYLQLSIVSLSVCCVTALFSVSIVSSSVCYVTILLLRVFYCLIVYYLTILFLQGFNCSVICLLRHCSVPGFSCLIFCLLRHNSTSSMFPRLHYMFVMFILYYYIMLCLYYMFVIALYVCYGIALFSSICCVTRPTSSSFHCFIICLLRHCTVLGFDCSIL